MIAAWHHRVDRTTATALDSVREFPAPFGLVLPRWGYHLAHELWEDGRSVIFNVGTNGQIAQAAIDKVRGRGSGRRTAFIVGRDEPNVRTGSFVPAPAGDYVPPGRWLHNINTIMAKLHRATADLPQPPTLISAALAHGNSTVGLINYLKWSVAWWTGGMKYDEWYQRQVTESGGHAHRSSRHWTTGRTSTTNLALGLGSMRRPGHADGMEIPTVTIPYYNSWPHWATEQVKPPHYAELHNGGKINWLIWKLEVDSWTRDRQPTQKETEGLRRQRPRGLVNPNTGKLTRAGKAVRRAL